MSTRIEQKFSELARIKRKGLITYVMGGDPDITASEKIIAALPEAGADILEIGMPFTDPAAEGPIIQAAGLRALRAGTKLKDVITLVKNFRKKDNATPVILMGYYNPVYNYGVEKFCKDATAAGADGMLLVDLPPEEEHEFTDVAKHYDLKFIRLITPTTDDNRLAMISKNAGGFLYYVSVAGTTGAKSADIASLKERVKHLKSRTSLPITVGFGIKTPEQAMEIGAFSDAIAVGSAIVEAMAKKPDTAIELVKSLRHALG